MFLIFHKEKRKKGKKYGVTEEADPKEPRKHSGSRLGMMENTAIIYHKPVHKK